ncbi:hypothetical protein [Sphingomonas sp. M1A8_2b]
MEVAVGVLRHLGQKVSLVDPFGQQRHLGAFVAGDRECGHCSRPHIAPTALVDEHAAHALGQPPPGLWRRIGQRIETNRHHSDLPDQSFNYAENRQAGLVIIGLRFRLL